MATHRIYVGDIVRAHLKSGRVIDCVVTDESISHYLIKEWTPKGYRKPVRFTKGTLVCTEKPKQDRYRAYVERFNGAQIVFND